MTASDSHTRILGLLPSAGDDASDAVRLALRLRNEATATGRCACSAMISEPVELAPGVFRAVIEHEADCPAANPNLARAIREGEAL